MIEYVIDKTHPIALWQDRAYVAVASQAWVFIQAWQTVCGDAEAQLNTSQATTEVEVWRQKYRNRRHERIILGSLSYLPC